MELSQAGFICRQLQDQLESPIMIRMCIACAGGGLRKKVNIHQGTERPEIPQMKVCVFFSLTGKINSLWARLSLSHPSYQLSAAAPLLPSFLSATLDLNIRSLKQLFPPLIISVFLLCLHFIQLCLLTERKPTFL